jgi:hypothetical protein
VILLTKVLEKKITYTKVIYLLLLLCSKNESILIFRSFNMMSFVITKSSMLGTPLVILEYIVH